MAKIIMVTGGARSGKSGYAQRLAESLPGPRTYVATCPAVFAGPENDSEMADRIRRHRRDREAAGWETVEETVALAEVLSGLVDRQVVLVDCLTLWVNNLVYRAGVEKICEDDIAEAAGELVRVCGRRTGTVILVTNEVGWGVVPDNPLARCFRDLAGRCNQVIAAAADEVVMVVCGIATTLKGERTE